MEFKEHKVFSYYLKHLICSDLFSSLTFSGLYSRIVDKCYGGRRQWQSILVITNTGKKCNSTFMT